MEHYEYFSTNFGWLWSRAWFIGTSYNIRKPTTEILVTEMTINSSLFHGGQAFLFMYFCIFLYGGFLKWWYPYSICFIGFAIMTNQFGAWKPWTPPFFTQVSCYTFSDAALDAENNGCVADLQRRIAKALGLPEAPRKWSCLDGR